MAARIPPTGVVEIQFPTRRGIDLSSDLIRRVQITGCGFLTPNELSKLGRRGDSSTVHIFFFPHQSAFRSTHLLSLLLVESRGVR